MGSLALFRRGGRCTTGTDGYTGVLCEMWSSARCMQKQKKKKSFGLVFVQGDQIGRVSPILAIS
jgi:hypothetical protein